MTYINEIYCQDCRHYHNVMQDDCETQDLLAAPESETS